MLILLGCGHCRLWRHQAQGSGGGITTYHGVWRLALEADSEGLHHVLMVCLVPMLCSTLPSQAVFLDPLLGGVQVMVFGVPSSCNPADAASHIAS